MRTAGRQVEALGARRLAVACWRVSAFRHYWSHLATSPYVQILWGGNSESPRALNWPASKKRQGTKSRALGLAGERYGDLMLAPISMNVFPHILATSIQINGLEMKCWITYHTIQQ